jgi:broad specificity phosphatase PhoE
MSTTTILIVRHGETDWNRRKIFRGAHDIPLNDNGRAQAGRLTGALPAIDAAYSSPLSRARETAQLALAGQAVAIQSHPGLVDIDYGEWTGKEDEEVYRLWPDEHTAWGATPHLAAPVGGEPLGAVSERVLASLHEVVDTHAGQIIAIFAHRVVNKLLVLGMLGLELNRFAYIRQDNCCISEFHKADDGYVVVRLNDTAHMRDTDILTVDF